MSHSVSCDTHGKANAAFACAHVLATLQDKRPRGLFFARDDEGCFNGWCADCEAMAEANDYDWTPEMMKRADVRLLCEDCFRIAMKINRVLEGH